MKWYHALILIMTALIITYAILQAFATVDAIHAPAQHHFDKTELSGNIQSLESNTRDLKSDVRSNLADIQYVDIWLNPNIDLSSGNQADIWSRIQKINSNTNDYQNRLDSLNRELKTAIEELCETNQSDPDVSAMNSRTDQIRNDLTEIQGYIDDIRLINARLNVGLLITSATFTPTPTPIPTPVPLPTPTFTPTPTANIESVAFQTG